jgi:hypothetical protein
MPEHSSDFIADYLSLLSSQGSLTPRAVKPLDGEDAFGVLEALPKVSLTEETKTWFRVIDGYDSAACSALDLFEPTLAWGMFALSLEDSVSHHDDCASGEDTEDDDESADYWPHGFLPLLWDGSGSYLVVNCIASSPTHGAVYDMGEGVGCNRVSNSLREFLAASAEEVRAGLRGYGKDSSSVQVEPREYLERAAVIFGHSPYFSRVGRMGSQIVDWR